MKYISQAIDVRTARSMAYSALALGVVITEAGNDPKVAGLVYVTAFAPDKANRQRHSLKVHPRVRPLRRSCRLRMDSYSSIRPSLPLSSLQA
jgi:hypothetical protein